MDEQMDDPRTRMLSRTCHGTGTSSFNAEKYSCPRVLHIDK